VSSDEEPVGASGFPVGLVGVALIVAGAWMLYHAKTADAERQPAGYKAWHWVAGGAVCLGCGALLGAYAIGLIGGET
jgi:hypothetical protein